MHARRDGPSGPKEDILSQVTSKVTLQYVPQVTSRDGSKPDRIGGLTLAAWVRIGIIAALMVVLFRFSLLRLWWKTNPFSGEPNWGHAIVIPLIGLYYLYLHREELIHSRVKTAWEGLGILLMGLLLFAYGIYPGYNDFVKDFGMIVTLFGVVLLVSGRSIMKIAWFPIAFLICGIPWPGLVYSWVAGPLQELAAQAAVKTLTITGVIAYNAGTKIIMMGEGGQFRTLNVAEACAGLRSLMTFISVGAAIAFLSARPLWQKLIITVSAVPIAIFCNVMRVTGQGLLDYYVSQELSKNFAHSFVGLVMLVPAFFLLLGVCWILDHLFVEEIEVKQGLPTASRATAGTVQPVALARPVAVARPKTVAVARPDAAARPSAAPRPAAAPRPRSAPAQALRPAAAPRTGPTSRTA